jgi:hypothetical protein
LLDDRLDEPDGDGQSKLEHGRERLSPIGYQKALPCQAVLLDTWDTTKELRWSLELFKKFY